MGPALIVLGVFFGVLLILAIVVEHVQRVGHACGTATKMRFRRSTCNSNAATT